MPAEKYKLSTDKIRIIFEGLEVGKCQEGSFPEIEHEKHEFNNGVDEANDFQLGKVKYSDVELKNIVFTDDDWATNVILAKESVTFSIIQLDENGNTAKEHKITGKAIKLSQEGFNMTQSGLHMETITFGVTAYEII